MTEPTPRTIDDLAALVSPLRRRMSAAIVRAIATSVGPLPAEPQRLVGKLAGLSQLTVSEIRSVGKRSQQLAKDFAATEEDPAARKQVIFEHLVETVPNERLRKGDMKAIERWLDLEALTERELMRTNKLLERQLCLLEMMASLPRREEVDLPPQLANTLWSLARPGQRELVREHALLAIEAWLRTGRSSVQRLRDRERLKELERICLDAEQHPFTQVAALKALAAADGELGADVCRRRIEQPKDTPDDFIVRGYAVGIWGRIPEPRPTPEDLCEARYDQSEHVRQHLMRALGRYPKGQGYSVLVRTISDEQAGRVIGEGLHTLAEHAEKDEKAKDWLETALVERLRTLRVSIDTGNAVIGIRIRMPRVARGARTRAMIR